MVALSDRVDKYDWEASADALEELLRPFYSEAIELSFGVAGERIGVGISFDESNPLILDVIDKRAKLVRNVTETTKEDIRYWVEQGTQEGLSMGQIAEQLRSEASDIGQARAEMIARTETAAAYVDGSLLAYAESGVVTEVEWLANGSDSCPECQALAGQVVKLGEQFDGGYDSPPAHPNCLIGSSLVVAPDGLIGSTFSRWFDGEVITISTASDQFLTCTPNHPILTPHGWVAAGDLVEGSYIIRSLDSKGIGAIISPDDDYVPTRIDEIARAAFVSGGMATRTMPLTPEDFHGDGVGSKVYVESTRSELGGASDIPTEERIRQRAFIGAIETAARLARQCSRDEVALGMFAASNGIVGGARDSSSILDRAASVDSFGGIAKGLYEACFVNQPPDSRGMDIIHHPNLNRGKVFGDVQVIERGNVGALASVPTRSSYIPSFIKAPVQGSLSYAEALRDLAYRFACLIAPVRIINIERREFSGHVYNLQTKSGWYIADSIITHNCTCDIAPIVES